MKIIKKVKFSKNQNRMKEVGDVNEAIKYFQSKKNKNLYFLLKKRFEWMNKYINEKDIGIEVGAGAGLSKEFILNSNLKTSDFSDYKHLDYKNIDAQNTKFNNNSYDFVIASNMIHHMPYPIKFFKEIHRILRKDGKLIIQDSYCSIVFQLITILMRHEGYDFTKDVWSESTPVTDVDDLWSGNIAIPQLIFDDRDDFKRNLGSYFKIEYENFSECFIFLNSGGVCSKTIYLPLNSFFLNILDKIDNILVKFFPKFFAMGRSLVLKKI
ncbi:class I SAM-dependent methyltransferase [Pelagibacteraceae bacterium]|nr:class I SAM-dependent methyltransferase [Pelagibacteraceae bacterium]